MKKPDDAHLICQRVDLAHTKGRTFQQLPCAYFNGSFVYGLVI